MRELAAELHTARRACGLSQQALAKASGTSRASISRLEHGLLDGLSIVHAAELASVLGLDLSVRAYPGSMPARDAGQLRLLQRLIDRLGSAWEWQFEVSIGAHGDRRAWDARAVHRVTGAVIVVEAVTRVTDVQATLRRIALKSRDSGSPRVVLLLAETRTNALVLTNADLFISSAFPVRTRRALRALSLGQDPGGDAVIVL